ncbi:MAG: FtsX-like permease family protein [Acidobacteria bacterium]|nr:FtsX-like permease family protein [Acidobacteriota bacterium]
MAGPGRGVGLAEGVFIALDAIWANKLRSFLTVLGNVIAISSIILVVTIIQGVNAEVTKIFTAEGADIFTVRRESLVFSQEEAMAMRSRPRLTREDARFLRETGTAFEAVVESADGSGRVEYGNESLGGVAIEGRSWEWGLIDGNGLEAGRYFSPLETNRARPVALIGIDVASELFPGADPESAIGRRIRVHSLHYEVVGVMKTRGSSFGFSRDEVVVVPIRMFQRMFGSRNSLSFSIKPRGPEFVQPAMDEARTLMRIRHRLRPADEDDFGISDSSTFLDLYNQFTAGIFGALVGIVAMALVVGGIVIMNIMLMVVTERTREVGIRKAVGATYNQVLWQFLVEAVTLSVFGGAVGITLGYLAAAAIAAFTPLPFVLATWSIVAALVTVIGVGVVFGIYPASRAAKLDPITALGYE